MALESAEAEGAEIRRKVAQAFDWMRAKEEELRRLSAASCDRNKLNAQLGAIMASGINFIYLFA